MLTAVISYGSVRLCERNLRTFWSDKNALCFDWSDVSPGIYTCQNSSKHRLTLVHFIGCKLNFKRQKRECREICIIIYLSGKFFLKKIIFPQNGLGQSLEQLHMHKISIICASVSLARRYGKQGLQLGPNSVLLLLLVSWSFP